MGLALGGAEDEDWWHDAVQFGCGFEARRDKVRGKRGGENTGEWAKEKFPLDK